MLSSSPEQDIKSLFERHPPSLAKWLAGFIESILLDSFKFESVAGVNFDCQAPSLLSA